MNRQDIRTDAPTRACVRPRKVLYLEFILIITQNKSKLQYYDECVVSLHNYKFYLLQHPLLKLQNIRNFFGI